jgi:hypothetical protein
MTWGGGGRGAGVGRRSLATEASRAVRRTCPNGRQARVLLEQPERAPADPARRLVAPYPRPQPPAPPAAPAPPSTARRPSKTHHCAVGLVLLRQHVAVHVDVQVGAHLWGGGWVGGGGGGGVGEGCGEGVRGFARMECCHWKTGQSACQGWTERACMALAGHSLLCARARGAPHARRVARLLGGEAVLVAPRARVASLVHPLPHVLAAGEDHLRRGAGAGGAPAAVVRSGARLGPHSCRAGVRQHPPSQRRATCPQRVRGQVAGAHARAARRAFLRFAPSAQNVGQSSIAASGLSGAMSGGGGAAAASARRAPWWRIMRTTWRRRPQARKPAYRSAP